MEIKKEDYIEQCCPLDTYSHSARSAPSGKIPIKEVLKELDDLYSRERNADGSVLLEEWLKKAQEIGDWSGELSIYSELMGHHRRTGDKEKGLFACEQGLKIIKEQGIENSVSAATVMLNAATTYKAFGKSEKSLSIFTHVSRVFADSLSPDDYRFAGLYNNMALTYTDLEDYENAEKCYLRALSTLQKCEKSENEQAVTYCNLCELYDKINLEDERIALCAEKAYNLLCTKTLARDGYHAFTISKCAPTLDKLGFFLWAAELSKRAKEIYERD